MASGPATGLKSRTEAGAVMMTSQQGIHISPSSRVPARRVSLAADAHPSVITLVITGLPFSFCKHGAVTKLLMLHGKEKKNVNAGQALL